MFASLKEEKRAADLSRARRIFLLVIISMGSSIIYTPAYLKFVFYNELMAALHITNEQVGTLLSAYAITATICYLPSGIVADKVRARTLSWVGFALTALLTFVYATLPSYNTLMFVFVGMGLTTILIWWGIRFKVIRLISGEGEYSRNIGLSYGLYGAAGLVVGLVNTFIVTKLAASPEVGMRVLIIFLGILIAVLAVLSFLFIPRFEGEIGGDGNGFSFKGVGKALSMPVVWLSSACMFFVYFYYTGVTYTTPYLKGALGASATLVLLIGTIRTYGITLFSGPVFGAIASKVGSPSRVITVGSVLAAVVLLGFVFLPQKPAIAVLAAVLVIFLGFVANGVFGIVSGQLTEGKVPLEVFGTASGLLSVVGFLPDTFSSTWFGKLMDQKGNAAYNDIFIILAISALIAGAIAMVLLWYVKKHKADEPLDEAVADAGIVEA